MKIKLITEKDFKKYEDFLKKFEESLLYYSLKYRNFLQELLECESYYYLLENNNEIKAIYPIMAKKGKFGYVFNSLPFYGSNGGVIAESQEYAHFLISEINKLNKETAINMYVSNPLSAKDYSEFFLHDIQDLRIGQITKLNIPDIENNLINTFHYKTRNAIRKAIKNNLEVKINNSMMYFIEETHRENMEKIGGNPKNSKFFKLIPKYFQENKDYNIYIAYKDNLPISGLLVFYYNKTVEYYTPVIKEQYRSLQPLSLIIYQAMIDSSKKGYKIWNWGGTWLTQTSLHRFKKRFNAQDKIYKYYIKVNNPDIYKSSKEELTKEYPYFYTIPFNILVK